MIFFMQGCAKESLGIEDCKFDFTVKTETPIYDVHEVLYCRRKIINSSGFSIR